MGLHTQKRTTRRPWYGMVCDGEEALFSVRSFRDCFNLRLWLIRWEVMLWGYHDLSARSGLVYLKERLEELLSQFFYSYSVSFSILIPKVGGSHSKPVIHLAWVGVSVKVGFRRLIPVTWVESGKRNADLRILYREIPFSTQSGEKEEGWYFRLLVRFGHLWKEERFCVV